MRSRCLCNLNIKPFVERNQLNSCLYCLRAQERREFTKQWFWGGEAHRVCDDLPQCIHRASGQLRASQALRDAPGTTWPTIIDHVARAKLNNKDVEKFIREVLDELSIDLAALDQDGEFDTIMSHFLAPVVRKKASSSGRTLKEQKSAGSDDSNELDVSVLAALMLETREDTQAATKLRASIPEDVVKEMQLVADLLYFTDCKLIDLKAARDEYANPKAPLWVRNVFGNPSFEVASEAAEKWADACKEAGRSWDVLAPILKLLGKEWSTMAAQHQEQVWSGASPQKVREYCEKQIASFSTDNLDVAARGVTAALQAPNGVLSPDAYCQVDAASSQVSGCTRHILELLAHLVWAVNKSVVFDPTDASAVEGAHAAFQACRDSCHDICVKLEKTHCIKTDKLAVITLKSFKLWLLAVMDLRIDHVKNLSDHSVCWQNCERCFKEKAGIETGGHCWFLPLKAAAVNLPWSKSPLLPETRLQDINRMITDERDKRNTNQNPKQEETYKGFVEKTSFGLIKDGNMSFMPALPAEVGEMPRTADSWVAIMNDAPKCAQVNVAWQSVATSKEDFNTHSAWLMLDMDEAWASTRRSAMQCIVRSTAAQKRVALLMSQWAAKDNMRMMFHGKRKAVAAQSNAR